MDLVDFWSARILMNSGILEYGKFPYFCIFCIQNLEHPKEWSKFGASKRMVKISG
jgi:hypothetical protein